MLWNIGALKKNYISFYDRIGINIIKITVFYLVFDPCLNVYSGNRFLKN